MNMNPAIEATTPAAPPNTPATPAEASPDVVRTQRSGPVAVISIHRPERRNALNTVSYTHLTLPTTPYV